MPSLQRCIPRSREARLAQQGQISYQEALARTFQRRNAYTAAQPFSVLVLGTGSDFLYRDGILTYLLNRVVHIINVHEASITESFIDLCAALRISETAEHHFRLLHSQDNVLSIFRTSRSSNTQAHLIVLDTRPDIIAAGGSIIFQKRLSIGQKHFVRHDSRHLVYGTYTGTEDSEDDAWGFQLFDLTSNQSTSQSFRPGSFTTADIGSNIVFEVFDGCFYAVTSQITVDCEGQDPSSYYGGCRYPLSGSPQEVEFWRIWRRQQREGPIHDLWTNLTLQKDENSHDLVLSESRREWQDGFSKQKRTFYTEPLDLTTISQFNVSYREHVELKKAAATSTLTNDADDEDFTVETLLSEVSDFMLPDLSLPHRRSSRHFQPEFCGTSFPEDSRFALPSIRYKSYHYSNSAFLDIVIDNRPPTKCPGRINCLRFRIGSRVVASPLGLDGLLQRSAAESGKGFSVDDEFYNDRGIVLWPPLDAPAELHDLLSGATDVSKLKAASDERSIVYMATTNDSNSIAPIVLINFDPSIRFPGLKRLGPGDIHNFKSVGAGEDVTDRANSYKLSDVGEGGLHYAASTAASSHKNDNPWARVRRAEWDQNCYGFEFCSGPETGR